MNHARGRAYLAIDLKSFYASVECVERGLDPLTTNLVVADESRTDKTICLAVSPSLKAYGIPGRARLFEVRQAMERVNAERLRRAPNADFSGTSCQAPELAQNPDLEAGFIAARPQMARYMAVSADVYSVYLGFLAEQDMHVYSIDEAFLDVTTYLSFYGTTAEELARRIIRAVYEKTGVTATAGIGTNLYLSKVALDIAAKHAEPDESGVRMAKLDEMSYRRMLWSHRPLTDFWRVGRGTARRLEKHGMYTMGDVARCSLEDQGLLYRLFGKNAELLIDHAWGWEPCTIAQIRAYRPKESSLGSGQVLQKPYPADKARIVLREMAEQLALDLFRKGLVADQIVLHVGYERLSLEQQEFFEGTTAKDWYGRTVPKPAHGGMRFDRLSASGTAIAAAALGIFDQIMDDSLFVRRMYLTANHVRNAQEAAHPAAMQLDFFAQMDGENAEERQAREEKERAMQKLTLDLQRRFGKNVLLKASSLQDGATAMERNLQIGGHRA